MLTLSLIITALVTAQPATQPPLEEIYIVDADGVVLRSGADRNFYAFMQVPRTSPVRVREVFNNWGRVSADGPLFDQAWGWVRHPANQPGLFKVVDQQTGQTLDSMPFYAPDLSNVDPSQAWRQICEIPVDTRVEIIDATEGEIDNRPFHFYKIRMPRQAEGWINMANLRPAQSGEVVGWVASTPTTVETLIDTTGTDVVDTPTQVVEEVDSSGQISYLARYINHHNRMKVEAERVRIAREKAEREAAARAVAVTQEKRYFDGLEKIFHSLPPTDMSEDLATGLWEGYAIVAKEDQDLDPETAQLALIRMRQLEIASCIREERQALDKLDAVVHVASQDVEAMQTVLDEPTEYVVLGKLNVSSIFTGNDARPIMYRVEDPVNGRTLAYLTAKDSLQLGEMIGQWIGVGGAMKFDSRWQVQVINPERVDLVAAMPGFPF